MENSMQRMTQTVMLLAILLLCSPAELTAATLTVGPDLQTCDFDDLGLALNAAADNDRIEVAAGTYRFGRVSLGSQSVWISGGHDGCGGPTIPGARSVLDAWKNHQVMDIFAGQPITVVIESIEFKNGSGYPFGLGPSSGGGLRVGGPVWLTLADVRFHNNLTLFGGGLALLASVDGAPSAVVTHSEFQGNTAAQPDSLFPSDGKGGAIECKGATLHVVGSRFELNQAYNAGGAIHADGCTVRVEESVFESNGAGLDGGAIASENGVLRVGGGGARDVQFQSNTAYSGGALHSRAEDLNVDGALFAGNIAKYGGGLYGKDLVSTRIGSHPCTDGGCVRFEQNEASQSGGAMALMGHSAEIFGVIGDGNKAGGLGGFLWAESAAASDLEIHGNVVQGGKGQGQVYARTPGKTRVFSSTFFDNPWPDAVLDLAGGESRVSHVIFSNNGGAPLAQPTTSFACNLIDGPFLPPANAVATVMADPLFAAPGDYHLKAASPAVNVCPWGPFAASPWDIDGDPRPDAAGLNDIGADER